jgi:dethiobiotin synthetase
MDGVVINITTLKEKTLSLLRASPNKLLIIEGAGGLLVPLSEERMVADLIKELNAKVILVSRNYLGSINHSLLTAAYCRANAIDVAGWIFNDDYMQYEDEIVKWSGYPSLGSVPALTKIDPFNIKEQAEQLRTGLLEKLVNS